MSDSDCDTTCVGDATQTCGGEDRIQIYDLLSNFIALFDYFGKFTTFDTYCIFVEQVNDGEPVVNEVVSNNLNEEFDNLNSQTLWNHDVYIPQEPVCINNMEIPNENISRT